MSEKSRLEVLVRSLELNHAPVRSVGVRPGTLLCFCCSTLEDGVIVEYPCPVTLRLAEIQAELEILDRIGDDA